MKVTVLLYQGVTALDAVGPYEVLSRLPDTEVCFVAREAGPVTTEGDALLLGAPYAIDEISSTDVLIVPGGMRTPEQMLDDETLDWLRRMHETSTWTASVCTGALILGAAGLLKGLPATTHWYKMGVLKIMGAKTQPDQRIVRAGKIVTAAGVSAGIDLALWLAGEIAGRERAEAIQLTIEYDPQPPFDAGHLSKASEPVRKLGKQLMDERMPEDQKKLVPKIAWRRFIDLVRTRR